MTEEIATQEPVYPWTDFDRTFDALRREFFAGFGLTPFGNGGDAAYLRTARTDIEETDQAYHLKVEVPGIPKENLAITIRGPEVEIRGEFADEKGSEKKGYVHRERRYAGFYRALELPEPVLGDKAKAQVDNGILSLELPKEHPDPTPSEVKVPVQ